MSIDNGRELRVKEVGPGVKAVTSTIIIKHTQDSPCLNRIAFHQLNLTVDEASFDNTAFQCVMERISSLFTEKLHPFGMDCHQKDYISQSIAKRLMNHEEKVQMLDEVNEIRALLLQLNKPTGTGGEFGGKGPSTMVPRGKRVLDLF